MLVAVVFVTPPRHVVAEPIARQHARAVRHVVVGVREAERREHERRLECSERGRREPRPAPRRDRLVARVVGVLDELEVHRRRVEEVERGVVLVAAGLHHVVAGCEARLHVPLAHRIGRVRGRVAGEHRHHERARMRRHEVAASEHGVVEVRRHDHDPIELARGAEGPSPASDVFPASVVFGVVRHGRATSRRCPWSVCGSRGTPGRARRRSPWSTGRARTSRRCRHCARCRRSSSGRAQRGDRRGTARVGADRVLDLADRAVEHVGHDPAPEPRLRSPADEVERRERLARELLDTTEQPAAVVRHAFEHRTREVGASSATRGRANRRAVDDRRRACVRR